MAERNIRLHSLEELMQVEPLFSAEQEELDRIVSEEPRRRHPEPDGVLLDLPNRSRKSYLRSQPCTTCGKEVTQARFAKPFVCEDCRRERVWRERKGLSPLAHPPVVGETSACAEEVPNALALEILYDQLEGARARERECQQAVLEAAQNLRQAAYRSGQIRGEIYYRKGVLPDGEE
jgi:predicted RNA-binding Zn-ribbon protein involved in translation (DUF1610 family)